MKITRIVLTCFALIMFLFQPIHAAASGPVALVLTIERAITPAMQDYLARGIQTAEQNGADVVILQLNTPGGGLDPMQKMAQDIRASTRTGGGLRQPARGMGCQRRDGHYAGRARGSHGPGNSHRRGQPGRIAGCRPFHHGADQGQGGDEGAGALVHRTTRSRGHRPGRVDH